MPTDVAMGEPGVEVVGEPALRVLGAVQVVHERGAIPIGRERIRSLLALLAIEPGREVSLGELSANLSRPGDEVLGSWVRTYLARLRQRLAATDGRVQIPEASERGYRLVTDSADHIELIRYSEQAESALRRADRQAALTAAELGLSMWGGRPYGDLSLIAFEPSRAHLESLHLRLEEVRFEAGLGLGDHHRLLPEIRAAVAHEPTREARTALLMLALYRAGQQRQALAAANSLRRALADVGFDAPGPEISRLERRIFDHDPTLAAPDRTAAVTVSVATSESALPLIGRESSIDRLMQVVGPDVDPAAVALVEGEPGMGKSVILRALAQRLRASGRTVAMARCAPLVNAPFEVIGSLARASGLVGVEAVLGTEQSRPAAFDEQVLAVTSTLRRALDSGNSRYCLMVDDAHWIDAGSAAVLARLDDLVPNRVGLVLAAHPLGNQSWRQLKGALRSTCPLTTVAAEPFTVEQVAEVLAGHDGLAPDAAQKLWDMTAGHPMLVTALVESGLDQTSVPTSVSEWVTSHLESLPEASVQVLRALAVVGSVSSVPEIAAVVGLPVDETAEALAHPAAAHLVMEDISSDLTIRLRHDLVSQALRDQTPATKAARAHLRAIEWEKTSGKRPFVIGWHALGAAALLPATELEGYLVDAIRHGVASAAFDQVVELCDAAPAVARSTALRVLHATALQELGDRARAIEGFSDALSEARRTNDLDTVVEIAGHVAYWAGSYRGEPAALALVTSAREYLAGRDDAAATRVRRAELLQAVMLRGPMPELRDELVSLSTASPEDEIAHLQAMLYLDAGSPDAALRLERADLLRAGLVAAGGGSRLVALDTSLFRLAALRLGGRSSMEERTERERFREMVREVRTPTFVWLDMVVDYDDAQNRGDFDEATRLAAEASAFGQAHALPDAEASALGVTALITMLRGELTVGEPPGGLDLAATFEHLVASEPHTVIWHGLVSLVRALAGDADGVAEAARSVARLVQAHDGHHLNPFAVVLAGHAACLTRDAELVGVLRPVLEPHAGSSPRMGQIGATLGPADRLLGTLASIDGDPVGAAELLRSGISQAEQQGGRPWVALGRHELAQVIGDDAMGEAARAEAEKLGLALPPRWG